MNNNSHVLHSNWHRDVVNTVHVGNRQQDSMLPSWVLPGAPSQLFWQWRVVQLWPDDLFNCVLCCLVKKHAAFKWKDAISGFPVSPGSAEAVVWWGGKIKYILIAYFLGNIFAKHCCNRTVYLKIIASERWDVILRHDVVLYRIMWSWYTSPWRMVQLHIVQKRGYRAELMWWRQRRWCWWWWYRVVLVLSDLINKLDVIAILHTCTWRAA